MNPKSTLLMVLLSLLFIPVQGQHPSTQNFDLTCLSQPRTIKKYPLEPTWIETDKERITSMFNKVPEQGSTLKSLEKLLPAIVSGEGNVSLRTEDLGRGLELIKLTKYGGYGSMYFEVIHHKGAVLYLNQYLSNYIEILRDDLLPRIEVEVTCTNGAVEHQAKFPDNIAAYQAKHPLFVVESSPLVAFDSTASALRWFTDISAPRDGRDHGKHVFDRYWKHAFTHIDFLIRHKKTAELEKMLYSPLPEGRLFAASALHYMKTEGLYEPTSDAHTLMQRVKGKGTVIDSGIISCWVNRFEYDHYDVYNDFKALLEKFR